MHLKRKGNVLNHSESELQALLDDENSHVIIKTKPYHISLHPYSLRDVKTGVLEYLDTILRTYDKKLGGIIIGYRNVKLLKEVGSIFNDDAYIHLDFEAEFFVFAPVVGCVLNGIVSKSGQEAIGCLVHRVFNVTIPRPPEISRDQWCGKSVSVGQKISFIVDFLDLTGRLPYIRGKLLDIGFSEQDNDDDHPVLSSSFIGANDVCVVKESSEETHSLKKKHKKRKREEEGEVLEHNRKRHKSENEFHEGTHQLWKKGEHLDDQIDDSVQLYNTEVSGEDHSVKKRVSFLDCSESNDNLKLATEPDEVTTKKKKKKKKSKEVSGDSVTSESTSSSPSKWEKKEDREHDNSHVSFSVLDSQMMDFMEQEDNSVVNDQETLSDVIGLNMTTETRKKKKKKKKGSEEFPEMQDPDDSIVSEMESSPSRSKKIKQMLEQISIKIEPTSDTEDVEGNNGDSDGFKLPLSQSGISIQNEYQNEEWNSPSSSPKKKKKKKKQNRSSESYGDSHSQDDSSTLSEHVTSESNVSLSVEKKKKRKKNIVHTTVENRSDANNSMESLSEEQNQSTISPNAKKEKTAKSKRKRIEHGNATDLHSEDGQPSSVQDDSVTKHTDKVLPNERDLKERYYSKIHEVFQILDKEQEPKNTNKSSSQSPKTKKQDSTDISGYDQDIFSDTVSDSFTSPLVGDGVKPKNNSAPHATKKSNKRKELNLSAVNETPVENETQITRNLTKANAEEDLRQSIMKNILSALEPQDNQESGKKPDNLRHEKKKKKTKRKRESVSEEVELGNNGEMSNLENVKVKVNDQTEQNKSSSGHEGVQMKVIETSLGRFEIPDLKSLVSPGVGDPGQLSPASNKKEKRKKSSDLSSDLQKSKDTTNLNKSPKQKVNKSPKQKVLQEKESPIPKRKSARILNKNVKSSDELLNSADIQLSDSSHVQQNSELTESVHSVSKSPRTLLNESNKDATDSPQRQNKLAPAGITPLPNNKNSLLMNSFKSPSLSSRKSVGASDSPATGLGKVSFQTSTPNVGGVLSGERSSPLPDISCIIDSLKSSISCASESLEGNVLKSIQSPTSSSSGKIDKASKKKSFSKTSPSKTANKGHESEKKSKKKKLEKSESKKKKKKKEKKEKLHDFNKSVSELLAKYLEKQNT